MVYNDNRSDGISVVFSLPIAADPGRNHWTRIKLTQENLGQWEPTVAANTASSTAGVTVSKGTPVAGKDTMVLFVTRAPDDKKFARLKVVITQ